MRVLLTDTAISGLSIDGQEFAQEPDGAFDVPLALLRKAPHLTWKEAPPLLVVEAPPAPPAEVLPAPEPRRVISLPQKGKP